MLLSTGSTSRQWASRATYRTESHALRPSGFLARPFRSLAPGGLAPNPILAAVRLPTALDELRRYAVVIFSDIGTNTLLLHPDTFERSLLMPNRLALLGHYRVVARPDAAVAAVFGGDSVLTVWKFGLGQTGTYSSDRGPR